MAKSATLRSWIEDGGGAMIQAFPDQVLRLSADETRQITLTWNVTTTQAGPYRLQGQLLRNGTVAVAGAAEFAIQPTVVLAGTIQPDRLSYGLDAPVQLTATLTSSGNFTIPLLTARVVVADQAGVPVQTSEQAVTDLVAGSSRTLNFTWNTGHTRAGRYTATLTMLVEGQSEATAVGELVIEAVPAVTGTLTPTRSAVPQGENLAVALAVNNGGNLALAPLPVRLILADATGTIRLTSAWSPDLEIDGVFSRSEEPATGALAPGSYRLRLACDLLGGTVILAEADFAVLDVTPPLLTVVAPLSGAIFTGPFELSVQAEDAGSGLAAVEYQLNADPWLPLAPLTKAGSFGLTWTPVAAEDGAYLLLFRAADQAGNLVTSSPVAFSIELCNPFADLTGTLSYQPQPLYQGREISFPYALVNGCGQELVGLNVGLQVSDPRSGALLYSQVAIVNPAAQSSQAGSFILAAPGLAAGDYSAVLRVSTAGQAARDLAAVSLPVQSNLQITAGVTDRLHLLVWLNSGGDEGESGSDHSDEHAEPCRSDKTSSGDHYNACRRHDLLEQAISGTVDYYYLAWERDEFEAQLRNPLVTDVLIIGDHLPLSGHYSEELREKVNSGTGLIASGWLPPADLGIGSAPAQALLGVVGAGSFGRSHPLRLTTTAGPVTSAGELPSGPELWKVTAAKDAEVAGWLGTTNKHEGCESDAEDDEDDDHEKNDDDQASPAIILHNYGQGRTIYYAFNYGRALTPESLAPLGALLGNSLHHVHRNQLGESALAPLEAAPLQVEVANPGEEKRLRWQAVLPPGLRLYDYQREAWQRGGIWQSDLTVAAGQSGRLSFSILAPEPAGSFALELEETTSTPWSERFSFAVPSDREALFNATRAALNSLRVSKADAARIKNINASLKKVRGRAILCDRDIEQNIHDLGQAIKALLAVNSLEVPAIRLRLDELLRIEESRWYFHPEDGCGDGDEHDKHRPESHGHEGEER